jgi:hypothetical protein
MNFVRLLLEKSSLSFSQIYGLSDPKRVLRAQTVRMPPLDVEAWKKGMRYIFSCKSFPSTTGQRQKGFLEFEKPKNKDIPLEDCKLKLGCTCPDFKYRWAWSLSQRGAADVGPDSLSQCINRAPRITNPKNIPGTCKHVLALARFLYGQDANFIPTEDPDSSSARLDHLIRIAKGKTIDENGDIVGEAESPPPETPEEEIPEVPEPPSTEPPPEEIETPEEKTFHQPVVKPPAKLKMPPPLPGEKPEEVKPPRTNQRNKTNQPNPRNKSNT